MNTNRNIKRAFTLIELLVVISIIALLLAILMPSLRKARAQAGKVKCLSQLRQLTIGCHLYATDYNNKMPPSSASSVALGTTKIYMGGYSNLGFLYREGYIKELKAYFCPNAKGSYSLKYNITDRNWEKRSGVLHPLPKPSGDNYLLSYQFRGIYLREENKKWIDNPRLAILMDVLFNVPDGPIWHTNGYNVAFVDGSCSFFKVNPKDNELYNIYFNPTNAPGYLSWRRYYNNWDWRGGRAVWAVLDASH